jgi:hypothetical protein
MFCSALAACAVPSRPEDRPAGAASLYAARCTLCHAVRDPSQYSFDTLRRFVDKYAWRAGVSSAERPILLQYLKENAGVAEVGQERGPSPGKHQ